MKIMREFKFDDMRPIKAIEQKIWKLFDILRGESITSEEYHVVLLLLSLYKDRIISNVIISNPADIHYNIARSIRNSTLDTSRQYLSIYQTFEPALKSISTVGLIEIILAISKVDKKILSENFSDVFDSLLYRITQSQGKFGGEFIQPVELTRFICALADLPEKSKIFNPFAGLASFSVFFDQGQDYFGQEINKKTWALGALRIMAFDRPGNSRYVCEDSIINWPNQSEKFDLILANPPYGMRLNQEQREVESNIRTVEQFLVDKGVKSLNAQGKLIVLMPQGFLFRGMQDKSMREYLVEQDLIDTVISLPGGLLLNTGIPLMVLVINKAKKWPGQVRFIDANKFVEAKNSREKILNDYALNSCLNKTSIESDVVQLIDNIQIREYDYNLNVPRYFQKHIEGVKLKEIVEIVRGRRSDLPEGGKMIRIRDLKDDKLDFKLDLAKVEDTEFRRPHLRLINESCLLLTTRWKTLKPTLFDFSGSPIFLNSDILSLKINKKVADAAYLINELHADYVEEQLESYRQGAIIPVIRRDDLLEVVIKLPSLEEQRAKVQGIVELSDKIKTLEKERNILAHGKAISQFNEFASLKHTLGRPRQNILDWTDNLLHFLSTKPNGFKVLNQSFADFYEIDILSVLEEIKRDVNFMTDVLEKGENGFIVEEFDKTIISIAEINNLINQLSSNGFNFTIKKRLLKAEKMKERGIQGNKILLKTLIDNLLTNAHKYGFEKKVPGNEVVFELQEVDDFLSIEVRNNGKPFPKNFDRENFITKYSTADTESGSGLGGYDIHRIASEFNNPDWDLNLNLDPIYPVKFKFQFPIKLIN
jgi:type I restriction enzyme M protein